MTLKQQAIEAFVDFLETGDEENVKIIADYLSDDGDIRDEE